MKILIQ